MFKKPLKLLLCSLAMISVCCMMYIVLIPKGDPSAADAALIALFTGILSLSGFITYDGSEP